MTYSFNQISEAFSTLWEWEMTEDYKLIDTDGITQFTFNSMEEASAFAMGEDDIEAYLEELYDS